MRRLAAAALLAACAGRRNGVGGHVRRRPGPRADTFAVVPERAGRAAERRRPERARLDPAAARSVRRRRSWPPREVSYERAAVRSGQRAGAAYGIPWQVLAAINKIESNFGRNMGPSSAGAIGWMQFMPDTWLRWGTDARRRRRRRSLEPEDAIFSAARYLAAAGGAHDLYRAVFAYNHAALVRERGARAGDRSSAATSTSSSRSTSWRSGSKMRAEPPSQRRARRWRRRSRQPPTVESRLAALDERAGLPDSCSPTGSTLEKEAFAGRPGAAPRRAPRSNGSQAELTTAAAVLDQARSGAHAASFHPAAAAASSEARADRAATSSRSAAAPSLVSRLAHPSRLPGRGHRRPGGRTALRARRRDRARRGRRRHAAASGFTSRRSTGPVWTYCHLSLRDPASSPGAVALRRPVGRSRRLDRPRHRPAPPSGPEARDELPAGHDVVRGVRRDRVHLAGLAGRRVSEHARLLGGSDRGKRRRRGRVHD